MELLNFKWKEITNKEMINKLIGFELVLSSTLATELIDIELDYAAVLGVTLNWCETIPCTIYSRRSIEIFYTPSPTTLCPLTLAPPFQLFIEWLSCLIPFPPTPSITMSPKNLVKITIIISCIPYRYISVWCTFLRFYFSTYSWCSSWYIRRSSICCYFNTVPVV